ncbi:hypothetical protein UACE39S_05969 [Ureibacillus acetophenoni]
MKSLPFLQLLVKSSDCNKEITSPSITVVKEAIEDGYKRLIQPSIERELRNDLTEKAEAQAIHIFSENLRSLLFRPQSEEKWC